MKSLIFIILSIYFKKWYEKEREKWYPVMIAQNIEREGMRINVRGRIQ